MGSSLLQRLLCARLGGRRWADLRVRGAPDCVAGGGHPPPGSPQFSFKEERAGSFSWDSLGVEWIGQCWAGLGTRKVNLGALSVMKGEGSSGRYISYS